MLQLVTSSPSSPSNQPLNSTSPACSTASLPAAIEVDTDKAISYTADTTSASTNMGRPGLGLTAQELARIEISLRRQMAERGDAD